MPLLRPNQIVSYQSDEPKHVVVRDYDTGFHLIVDSYSVQKSLPFTKPVVKISQELKIQSNILKDFASAHKNK